MSRVLAAPCRAHVRRPRERQLATAMVASEKAHEEHAYAVTSVAQALGTHCTDLDVPAEPSVLRLANVTPRHRHQRDAGGRDLRGRHRGRLHPTAAVCGERPRNVPCSTSSVRRNSTAEVRGPVRWFDANGDGEFGIALRCGQIAPDQMSIELLAGCGIVAGSDPDSEFRGVQGQTSQRCAGHSARTGPAPSSP